MWIFVLAISVLKVPFSSSFESWNRKTSTQLNFVNSLDAASQFTMNLKASSPFNSEHGAHASPQASVLVSSSQGPSAQKLAEPQAGSQSEEQNPTPKSKKSERQGIKRKSIVRRRNLKDEEVELAAPTGTIIPGIQWETLMKYESRDVYAQEQVWKLETINRYLDQSERVVVATIIEHRLLNANLGLDVVMEVEVEDYLLGEGDIYLTLDVPYVAPFVASRPETVPPVVVDSYRMLIFIDAHKRVVEGNGMFVLEGEYAWRNKRPDVFLNPRYDRDWAMESPIPDYVMFSMSEVLQAIAEHNEEQPFWRRRRFRGFSFD